MSRNWLEMFTLLSVIRAYDPLVALNLSTESRLLSDVLQTIHSPSLLNTLTTLLYWSTTPMVTKYRSYKPNEYQIVQGLCISCFTIVVETWIWRTNASMKWFSVSSNDHLGPAVIHRFCARQFFSINVVYVMSMKTNTIIIDRDYSGHSTAQLTQYRSHL